MIYMYRCLSSFGNLAGFELLCIDIWYNNYNTNIYHDTKWLRAVVLRKLRPRKINILPLRIRVRPILQVSTGTFQLLYSAGTFNRFNLAIIAPYVRGVSVSSVSVGRSTSNQGLVKCYKSVPFPLKLKADLTYSPFQAVSMNINERFTKTHM